ncbi:hypothetical protein CH333_03295 [candidate division WOR-3 bacterium JGI_Cruoil_03_44_89]|uniref:DNA 3'-5' helicase n=1 Tax=candidate division WOR-3 bacterium JGI_Cruoil_03_44_89 TaxID=1973748 RepID=A0A235BY79_UNCW3|nr:MAG: hypothetical protein CH333_07455 [candidate division WOR-3 bacterium JGI_Cruoil_03_44_89]OYD16505.1 MAG: hypothetical protein CH333_03295 [candidate division WOR-3 bacterium JGI_Cruoil_03_44_89]
MRIDYERALNEEQYNCVTAGEGPIYVLAGAGSGKTRVLTYRTAWLIENGVLPNRIMLLTFTNKAAREMLTRVETLTGLNLRNLWGGTFHHIGNLILRRMGNSIGLAPDFMIIDEGDANSLLNECKRECGIPRDGKFPKAKVLKEVISNSVNSLRDISTTLSMRFPHLIEFSPEIVKIEREYRVRKKRDNLMDFDDLLYYWWEVLNNGDLVYNFEHILIDEYQDTNLLQAKIVDKIAEWVGNITVVGDDAQSIYSFRGADYKNIRDFPLRYPDTKIYKLETNYRSTPQILHLANEIIERSDARFKKRLIPVENNGDTPTVVATRDTYDQARFVVYKIRELIDRGDSYCDIGVLYRAHYQSAELEIQLSKSDIPYIVRSGARFFERAHIKDVLSYLRVIVNPRDSVSFKRLLKLEEGIGDVTAQKIYDKIGSAHSPLHEFLSSEQEVPERAVSGIRNSKRILGSIIKLHPSEAIKFIFESGYGEYLELSYPDAQERKEDVGILVEVAKRHRSLSRFLSEVTLSEPATGEDSYIVQTGNDSVVLSTIHRAKGLEWKVVFLIYACDGGLPMAMSYKSLEQYEEERRLFYVAVTRAKRELYITYPMRSSRARSYLSASPFLRELDEGAYQMMWL